MKTDKNILIAFILNLAFSIFEFIGGMITNSVAITSDALHDIGDAASIGISYFMEKKSKQPPNDKYTYGYARFSVLGSLIMTTILIFGSALVVTNAIKRLITPVEINYTGMILFSIIGIVVNLAATYVTRGGGSLNQKAVNLHMLEDVAGWFVVLIGAIAMSITKWVFIDAILSICTAMAILISAVSNATVILSVINEKSPKEISVRKLKHHLSEIEGVNDVHHVHVWTIDGYQHYATMHVVTNSDTHKIKNLIRKECKEHGINHVTIETEFVGEQCDAYECSVQESEANKHPTHHHHHHHH